MEFGVEVREVDRTARLHRHDPGPVLSPDSRFTLAPGMIVTIEPGVYDASLGTGCRIEDNVLVTEDGFELLSTMPRSLPGN